MLASNMLGIAGFAPIPSLFCWSRQQHIRRGITVLVDKVTLPILVLGQAGGNREELWPVKL